MGTVFTLRITSELAFYFYFASFVGGILGMESAPVVPYLIIILCCIVSWSQSKHDKAVIRMASFCLLGLCAFFINNLIGFFVVLPATIYAAYTCYKRLFGLGRDFNAWFIRAGKIMLLLLVFAIFPERNYINIGTFIPEHNYVTSYSASFGLMFLFSSVYLMRILRHDEETIKQPQLRLINAAVLAGVGGIGFILSNDGTFKLANSIIRFIYQEIIVRVFMFIFYVINLLMTFLASLTDNTIKIVESETPSPESEIFNESFRIDPETLPRLDALNLTGIVKFLLIITALVVVFLLFKHMLGRRASKSEQTGATEIRSRLNAKQPPRRKRLFALGVHDSRGQIRAVYRKFLKLCDDYGISTAPSDTSLSIHNRAAAENWCQANEAWKLRELYISARYSEYEPEKEDVQTIKKHFSVVRTNSKNRGK